jgi:DUF4097 and DUF4098 domain-containing protein YvlB
MSPWEFPVPGPIEAAVRVPFGSVTVRAEPTQTATVRISTGDPRGEAAAAEVKVQYESEQLRIVAPEPSRLFRSAPSIDVSVTLPPGSKVTVNTASADVHSGGELAELTVNTASGNINADLIAGHADVTTASGAVRLDRPGRARVRTVSGGIRINDVDGDVDSQTVSGDVAIGTVKTGQITITTTSGDITVVVARNTGVQLDVSSLSGRTQSELTPAGPAGEADVTVIARSIKGHVRVNRAA